MRLGVFGVLLESLRAGGVGADAEALDGLARRALGTPADGGVADERALGGLGRAGRLEDALTHGGAAEVRVLGAGQVGAALGRAERAGDAGDGDFLLRLLARTRRGVAIGQLVPRAQRGSLGEESSEKATSRAGASSCATPS